MNLFMLRDARKSHNKDWLESADSFPRYSKALFWLVCVRRRYDGKRIKTVELAIEAVTWEPEEKAMQNEPGKAGGVWDRKERLWEIDLKSAKRLGMMDRIITVIPGNNG
jgi:hypothetical protein